MPTQNKLTTVLAVATLSVALMTGALANKVVEIKNQQLPKFNTYSQQQLEKLPGIGKKKAQAIIHYRQKNGKFKTLDDLTKIKGISKHTLDRMFKVKKLS